jgi:hypothetical protein
MVRLPFGERKRLVSRCAKDENGVYGNMGLETLQGQPSNREFLHRLSTKVNKVNSVILIHYKDAW